MRPLKRPILWAIVLVALIGVVAWRTHHPHRHRLREAIVVDAQGRACYLDHHNSRIYRYVLGDGSYYSPSGYDPGSPSPINLPRGGSFTPSPEPASAQERTLIESQEAAASHEGVSIEETVDATDDQIAAWENEGGSIAADDSDSGDSGDGGGDSGDGGGDSGGDGGGDGGGE